MRKEHCTSRDAKVQYSFSHGVETLDPTSIANKLKVGAAPRRDRALSKLP